MRNIKAKDFFITGILFSLFLVSIFNFNFFEKILILIIKPKNMFIARETLFEIAQQHIYIVLVSSFLSILIAITIAIITRFSFLEDVENFILEIATFGQTIPTVAILALLVPFLGYGFKPALFALFVYGILPVLRNAVEGFNSISEEIRESARAMGMSKWQIIKKVELPLSFPAIIAGIRVSLILNISVATIGGAVGLKGFGTFIVNGIRSDDIIMILKGAIPVSLLALTVDSLFMNLEKKFKLTGSQ
ncbi:MAG: ABC transporter permease [Atribacterota bacterium]|nr:ABC transporter permease [Atribacterota bacterium]